MKEKKISLIEQKLLEEVIRPAITTTRKKPVRTEFYIASGVGYTLHFDILLKKIKEFYKRNEGKEWNKVIIKAWLSNQPKKE